jgi:hypothetical protein
MPKTGDVTAQKLNIPKLAVESWVEKLKDRSERPVVVSNMTALMRLVAAHLESCFAAGHDIDQVLADAREAGIDEDMLTREQLETSYANFKKKHGKAASKAAPEKPAATPTRTPAARSAARGNDRSTQGSTGAKTGAADSLQRVDPLDRKAVANV